MSCVTAFTQVPSDAEIRKILADRVGAANLGIGIVIDVIDANGRRVVAYGSLAKNDKRRQSPGTEAAVRRMIQELQLGEPNYALMSAQLAEVTRQQLPHLKTTIAQFGALQSISFKGVGPGGADIYEVKFEHATTEWRVVLSPDGKIQGVTFRPL